VASEPRSQPTIVDPGDVPVERRTPAPALDRTDVLLGSVLVATVLAVCCASGAFTSDFTNGSDEAGHVVSSLMVRDYLTQGLPHDPVAFAEQYYLHYPKVAIGHWPPLFHVIASLWLLAFGVSRLAMVALATLLAAALPLGVYFAYRDPPSRWPSFLCAAMLATAPVVGRTAFTVAPDGLMALHGLAVAFFYGRYLDSGRRRHAVVSMAAALGATLTNARGVVLFAVPLWAGLLRGGRRQRLLCAAALLPAAILLWHLPAFTDQIGSMTVGVATRKLVMFTAAAFDTTGWLLLLLALVGVVAAVADPRNRPHGVAMAALLLALWSFHTLVNVPAHPRYTLPAAGAVSGLAVLGWREAARRTRFDVRVRGVLALLAAVTVVANLSGRPTKPDLDYHLFVDDALLADPRSAISLVAGLPLHEGAYVSEMALRDRELQRIVLRGSKVLASSGWVGDDYRELFAGPEQISGYLDDAGVGLVVLERGAGVPHEVGLLRALEQRPDRWREDSPRAAAPPIRVFRRIGPMPESEPRIHIDMSDRLGRRLELKRWPGSP
jgi:hypothetical protein